MAQVIGVPKETFPLEKRVATVPDVIPKLAKLGFSVIVQSGAGEAASIGDDAYAAAGARVVPDAASVWSGADIIFKVRAPSAEEVQGMREVTTIAFIAKVACKDRPSVGMTRLLCVDRQRIYGMQLGPALKLGARVLGSEGEALSADQLEVALLDRARPRRAFRRIKNAELTTLLNS